MTTLNSQIRRNFFHLYGDIFWFGVLTGSTLAFLAIYASRLGASNFQVGLLTAGPAIVNLFISLPAGKWLGGKSLVRVSKFAVLVQRLGYLVLVPLPWLFSGNLQVWMMLSLSLVMAIPNAGYTISFNALFGDVVPPEYRGGVVGRRNALVAVSTTVTALICGQLLKRIDFPLNYQVVFGIGAFGGLMSAYHIGRLRLDKLAGTLAEVKERVLKPSGRLLRLDLLRGPYGTFMLAYLALYTFMYVSVPLNPLFVVREVAFSDITISVGNALFWGFMFIVSLRMAWISRRFGHRRVLVVGAFSMSLYPLLTGLSWIPLHYYIANVVGGVSWGLTGGSLLNRLMERVPVDDRPDHMALYNMVLNLGMLGGSMIGSTVATLLGLRDAMLLSAGVRALAGFLRLLWG